MFRSVLYLLSLENKTQKHIPEKYLSFIEQIDMLYRVLAPYLY